MNHSFDDAWCKVQESKCWCAKILNKNCRWWRESLFHCRLPLPIPPRHPPSHIPSPSLPLHWWSPTYPVFLFSPAPSYVLVVVQKEWIVTIEWNYILPTALDDLPSTSSFFSSLLNFFSFLLLSIPFLYFLILLLHFMRREVRLSVYLSVDSVHVLCRLLPVG